MADISLLFDVATGNGNPSGDTESTIRSQLETIVSNINQKPFSIKFQADEESLKQFQQNISKIASTIGTVANTPSNGFNQTTQQINSTVRALHSMRSAVNETNLSVISNALSDMPGTTISPKAILDITNRLKEMNVTLSAAQIEFENLGRESEKIPKLIVEGADAAGNKFRRSLRFDRNGDLKKDLTSIGLVFEDIEKKSQRASSSTSTAVQGSTEEFTKAKKAVKDYYNALIQLSRRRLGDIIVRDIEDVNDPGYEYSSWSSNEPGHERRVEQLNELVRGYKNANDAQQNFSESEKKAFNNYKSDNLKKYQIAVEDVTNAENERAKKQKSVESVIRSYSNSVLDCKKQLEGWSAAEHSTHESSRTAYEGFKATIDAADVMEEEYRHGRVSLETYTKAIDDMKNSSVSTKKILTDNGDAAKTLGDHMLSLGKKFTEWLGVSQIIMYIYNGIKKMVGAVKEIDAAMTELKKVTNETNATYAEFLARSASRAKSLGVSVSDRVTATSDFARLGYDIEDSEKLADAAIIYKNVGDGIESISDASESIIATMQAFGTTVEDTMNIVDKFNAVGNNFAISSKGIGEALLRSASAMHAAGNTLDETIALTAAANTVVQNPESVGTTLKTVSMYLRAAKTEAAEAGESTDGMANSVSELRDEILSLTGQKVDIQIDEDTFKSTYEILQELSAVWDDLSDISQANILELIGGKRNSNVVSAILENFSVAEKALKTSQSAAGSALEENSKHLDSIQGKIDKFKASFEALSINMISGNSVKQVIGLGADLIDFIGRIYKLIEAVGGLNTVLGETIGVVGILNANKIASSFEKFFDKFGGLFNSVSMACTDFATEFADAFKASRLNGANQMKSAISGLSSGFKSLTSNISGAISGTTLAIGALSTAVMIIGAVYSITEKTRQQSIERNSALVDECQTQLEQTALLKDAYITYNEYNSAIEHTAAEETAYQNAIKTVTELIGNKEKALKSLKEGTDAYTASLNNAVNAEVEDAAILANKQVHAAETALNESSSSWMGSYIGVKFRFETAKPEVKEVRSIVEEIMGDYIQYDIDNIPEIAPINWERDKENMAAVEDYYYKLIELQDQIANRDRNSEYNLMDNRIYDSITHDIATLEPVVKDYTDAKLAQAAAEYEADKGVVKTTEDLKVLRDGLRADFGYLSDTEIDNFLSTYGYSSIVSDLQKLELEAETTAQKRENIARTMLSYGDYANKDTNLKTAERYLENLKEYEQKLSALSSSDLEIANIVVSENSIASWEELISAIDKYKDTAKGAAIDAKEQLQTLWESEGFSDTKAELKEIAKTVGKISPEKIKELASESDDLAEILEIDGMNAEFVANILTCMGQGYDGLELITEDALELNDALVGMADEFDKVTEAKQKYDNAMSVEEKDTNFKSAAEAFKTLNDEFTKGTTNSNAFWASAEFLFGSDQLALWGWEDGLDKIYDAMQKNVGVFRDVDSAGYGFAERLYEISEAGKVFDENGNVIAEISKLADGGFSFNIDYENIDALAKKTNLSKEAIMACIQAWSMWADIDFYNIEEVASAIDNIGLSFEKAGNKVVNIDALTEHLVSLGKTDKEISDIIEGLVELDGVKLFSVDDEASELTETLSTLGIACSDGKTVEIDYVQLAEMMKALQYTEDDAQSVITKLGELDGVRFTNQLGSGAGGATDVAGVLDYIKGVDFAPTKSGVDAITSAVNSLTDTLNGLDGKNVSVKVDIVGSFKQSIAEVKNFVKGKFATGTNNAPAGPALVGERGEEVVQSDDEAYFVGTNGPELVYLNRGDRVYTAEETKKIKKSAAIITGRIPSYENGGVYGAIGAIAGINSAKKWKSVLTNGSSNSSKSSKSKSSSKSSKSNSSSKTESEFERLYKYHQHLVAMDAESMSEYLAWLNNAYEEAYKKNEIELDDYYKYQEEVYDKYKTLFKDYLNDVEHEISMRENYEGETNKIISLYEKLMEDTEKEIAAARDRGLDDTNDYIQDLQQKWQGYSDSIKDIRDEVAESAKDAMDELIDYRIDMIKQDIENEKDSLDKKLDYLKEFYDKQKEMLQDQHEEEQYLKEQSEKRKSVSDIQSELAMIENDDSAWAQRRKLELQEELVAAQDELNEFEDEHALDMVLNALEDAYDSQEAQIQAEMDALDEMLNDPEAIYNKALMEIKNNTGSLYQEMLEYNKKYGTGNDEDVKNIYEEAYKSLLAYKDLYGEAYNGTELTNSTNYKPNDSSWDTEKISGTNASNKQEHITETPDQADTKPNESYPYGKVSNSSKVTKQGDKGSAVKAIQYALNKLGFGNSGTNKVDGTFGSGTVKAVKAFQKAMGIKADGIVGKNTRAKFKAQGYASGTRKASPGIHTIDELGVETIFESADGSRYKMFTGGEKVLNARASDFLYDFANNGRGILEKIIKSAFGTNLFEKVSPLAVNNEINMGDIIIEGSAGSQTVSEIRRAQRESISDMLKSLNRLNK